ncbi:MAG: adenylate/guanylate cyclase domain-containing protein [Winogradskyella sp.]|uniref:adenylate/guanylate cyclase domain-containing protein n=1 Tax=Winogradskyella sp. TaxID=1883156 RepID=UPI000F3D1A6A|nr:adenylate/guanylate cyclase domain-containing protein [Winogradskyella sp.]RNC80148.1 MAG: adenylate/guanylate cyclase domain-containing protein [Winogradskyella sp.]
MSYKLKSFFRLLLISVVFWTIAFVLLTALRYNGLENQLKLFTDEERLYLPIREYYFFSILIGLIVSVFYTIIEFIFDRLSKRLILGLSIIFKSIVYFILIVIILSASSFLLEIELDRDLSNDNGWWKTNLRFWTTVVYFVIASVVFSLIRLANDRFGRGNFIQVLLGTYKRPKEQERVLMFIDLKDSTKIAEHIGHKMYSQFIQDCFIDLNITLGRYDAEVYQYVGDEAVIYWPSRKGFHRNNCINLFYAFQSKLKKKKAYYNTKYGFMPEFKAGIHFGKLMVAEVGTVKKDLAFHGDVINTASRIQSLCNSYGKKLLVSESVLTKLNISDTHYELISQDIELRGKQERLKIYAINYSE